MSEKNDFVLDFDLIFVKFFLLVYAEMKIKYDIDVALHFYTFNLKLI